jgi:hypothetical protein
MLRRLSGVRLLLVGLFAAGLVGALGGVTYAAFSAATANPDSAFTAKRIYPAERGTSAWKLNDRSTGTAADRSDEISFADDGRTVNTGNWAAAFSASRYVELDLYGSLPAGLSVSNASFSLRFRTTGGTGCFYFEVRRASTGVVLATHGSSGTPLACHGTTLQTTATPIPSVSSTDIANDLRIRVFGNRSGGGIWVVDEVVATGSTPYAGFTLYEKLAVDATTGTPFSAAWELAVENDGSRHQTSNWTNAYSGTRYVEFTFPSTLPSSATVTAAAVDIGYRPTTNGPTACFYLEIYAGGTLIGTHGSTGASLSCHNTNATTLVHAEALAEVDTAAEANALTVRLYARNSASSSIQFDLARLRVTSSLEPGSGCANPGAQTLYASADTNVRENNATTNYGTDANVRVRSATGNNRRTLVSFSLPSISPGCSVTGATLRLFHSTSQGTRTLEVFRAAAAWTETGVNWNNQPAGTGTAVTGANGAGWRDFTVTQHVLDLYASGNFGFLVRDSVEGSATDEEQTIHSREGTNDPQLVLTIG